MFAPATTGVRLLLRTRSPAAAGDAGQQNSIAISQPIQAAAQQYFCN
jgi:hypothetical protein